MRVHAIVALILTGLSVPASAFEVETRLVAKDLQRAEQLISAAEIAQDFPEMKRQADRLLSLVGKLPDKEDVGIRITCAAAAQSLRNLADDLSEPKAARRIVSATRERRLFVETMPQCEEAVGLQPTALPNLRTPR